MTRDPVPLDDLDYPGTSAAGPSPACAAAPGGAAACAHQRACRVFDLLADKVFPPVDAVSCGYVAARVGSCLCERRSRRVVSGVQPQR